MLYNLQNPREGIILIQEIKKKEHLDNKLINDLNFQNSMKNFFLNIKIGKVFLSPLFNEKILGPLFGENRCN